MRSQRTAMKSSSRSPQLEKARTQQQRPNVAKNKLKKNKKRSADVSHYQPTATAVGGWLYQPSKEDLQHYLLCPVSHSIVTRFCQSYSLNISCYILITIGLSHPLSSFLAWKTASHHHLSPGLSQQHPNQSPSFRSCSIPIHSLQSK